MLAKLGLQHGQQLGPAKKNFPGPHFVEKIRATRKRTNIDALSNTVRIITTSGKFFWTLIKVHVVPILKKITSMLHLGKAAPQTIWIIHF